MELDRHTGKRQFVIQRAGPAKGRILDKLLNSVDTKISSVNFLLWATVLIVASCVQAMDMFSLKGFTAGLADGTILYLDDAVTGALIDSTLVQDNTFAFKSRKLEAPSEVVLRTTGYTHFRYLWAENKPMTFNQTQTTFRQAIVTGSDSENRRQALQQRIEAQPEHEQSARKAAFVDKHPDSPVSAGILYENQATWGRVKTKTLFDQLSKANQQSAYGKKVAEFIKHNKGLAVGDTFANFSMTDTAGVSQSLSNAEGKIILLEFWASWCTPCRQENPNLLQTYRRFKPRGFEIFAVSLDTDRLPWIEAIEKDGLEWQHVSDLADFDSKAALIYGVDGIPDNFLIDENGIIVGRDLHGEELDKMIAKLLD